MNVRIRGKAWWPGVLTGVVTMLSCVGVRGQTWTNTAGGLWGGSTNWVGGVASGSGAAATFGTLGGSAGVTVTVDGQYTVGRLLFGNQSANPAAGWTIDGSGAPGVNYLLLATNTGTSLITVTNLGAGQVTTIGAELAGAGSVLVNGPGTLVLSGTNIYAGATIVTNGATLVIGAANALPAGTALILGDTNNGSVGNLTVSNSQTVASLTSQSLVIYTAASPPTNLIVIPTGQELTVNGNAVFGYNPTAKRVGFDLVSVAGGGTLAVNTNGGLLRAGATDQTSSAAATSTLVDMSGLAALNINLGTTNTGTNGSLFVGDLAPNVGSNVTAVLTLASNTTVTANTVAVGVGGRLNTETLLLGGGTNIFNVNSNLLGVSRDEGQIYFYTNTGSLVLRAADGVGRSFIGLGYNISGANGASNQFVNLGGHYVDLALTSLLVGYDRRAGYCSNYFGFDTGVLDTESLVVGSRSGTPTADPSLWLGVCNLGGGTVRIGTNGISMGVSAGSEASTVATNIALLNISGGLVTVSNDIVLLTQKASSGDEQAISTLDITGGTNTVYGNIYCQITTTNPGPHTATLTLNGGVLDLTGHAIGGVDNVNDNPTNYVDVLNFEAGMLLNVGQINGDNSSLVKSGTGMLVLAGTNTYSGGTIVSNGTLVVPNDGALGSGNVTVARGATLTLGTGVHIKEGYIAPSGNLILSNTCVVNLTFVGTNDIAGLSFDGGVTFQALGTWGSLSSTATYKTSSLQGPGLLQVQFQIPVPTTTTLTTVTNISSSGQSETFAVVVAGANGTPTGTASFYNGYTLLGTETLTGGVATLTTSALAEGTNPITAVYNGDATYEQSTAASIQQVVTPGPSPTPPQIHAASASATNLVLELETTEAGYNYLLESAPILTSPIPWTITSVSAGTGNGIANTVPMMPGTPQQFFRYEIMPAAASYNLIDQLGPHAIIVIGDAATEVEQFAASELQSYVAQITGSSQNISVLTASQAADLPATNEILIGQPETNPLIAQLGDQFGVDLTTNTLGCDGYVVKSINTGASNVLILSGSNNRSALFSVYHLLETWGARFYGYKSRNGEIIPHQAALTVPPLNIIEKPGMAYRFVSCNNFSPTNTAELIDVADWGAKNRCNAFMLTPVFPGESWSQIDLDDVKKRGLLVAGPGHILAQLTPSTNLFATHPEYFPLINGARNMVYSSEWGGSLSFCYTNAMQIVVSNTVAYYRQNPFIDILAVFPPDGSQNSVQCQDSICSKLSESDWYLTMMNDIDIALRQLPAHPKLMWISYDELGVAPTNVVPYDHGADFVLEWCNQIRDFGAPMDSASNLLAAQYLQWNASLVSICTGWKKNPGVKDIAAGYRWQNWSNFLQSCDYAGSVTMLDYYNLNVSESLDLPLLSYCQTGPWPGNLMQEDFTFYASQGIDGWQNCTDYYNDSPNPYWNWLGAQLMWKPPADMTVLNYDFYQHLYGPAWPIMQDYFTALWSEMASSDYSLAGYNQVELVGQYLDEAATILSQTNNPTFSQALGQAELFQTKCLAIKQQIPLEYNPNGFPVTP
jgi:autotransporter-associated beta strand protein